MNIQFKNIQNNYSINYNNVEEIQFDKGGNEKRDCCKISDCRIL